MHFRKGLCLALGATSTMAATNIHAQSLELGGIDVIGATPFAGSEVDADRYPANVQHADSDEVERAETLNLNQYMQQELGSVHVNDAVT